MTLVVPGFGPPFVAEHRKLVPVALVAHLAGGLTAMGLGPWQLKVASVPARFDNIGGSGVGMSLRS